MTDTLTIALAQLNPTVGAINANLAKAREAAAQAGEADLILFPELFICGYPPEDLVLRPTFVAACRTAVEDLARDTASGPAMLMGLPWRDGTQLHNAVALLNKELGKAMIRHSLNRLYDGNLFGSGWPMSPPRDYPNMMAEDNFTIVYDSTHVDPHLVDL